MTLIQSKPAVKSLGVWGGITALVFMAANIVMEIIMGLQDPMIQAVLPSKWIQYIAAAGAAVALIGRVYAKTQIKGVVSQQDPVIDESISS